jgi:hypothetical protein
MEDELADIADAFANAMGEADKFLRGFDTDADGIEALKKGLKNGWPGSEDPFANNPRFKKYFTADGGGEFTSWIDNLEVERDAEGNLRFKKVGGKTGNPADYFSADDINQSMGKYGPSPGLGRRPWLLDSDLTFNGKTLTSDERSNLSKYGYTNSLGGVAIDKNTTIKVANAWGNEVYLTPQLRATTQGTFDLDYVFTREQLEESALGRASASGPYRDGPELVAKYFNDGGKTVKLKGYNLGSNTCLRGFDSKGFFEALGMVENGKINIGGESVDATAASEALDTQAEKRYNTGARLEVIKGKNVWESSCDGTRSRVCCGDAAAVVGNFSDIGNRLDSEYGNVNVKKQAQVVRDAVRNYRNPKVTTTRESVVDDLSDLTEEEKEEYKSGRDTEFKKQKLNRSSKGRIFRNQADLDKLKKGLKGYFRNANSQEASEAFETFEREAWPIGEFDDGLGNITPPPLANDVKTLQKLEKAFANMRKNDNPLFKGEGSTNDDVKAAAEKRIQQWRRNNGLGVNADGGSTEGWYQPKDPENLDGDWECIGSGGDCDKAAPDNAARQIEKLQADPDTKKFAEKVKEGWRWYHYIGYGFLAVTLLELLISHAEAMSGCFLVPTSASGQGQEYLPSYKINPMTCLQRNKTWGSGYFLGISMGNTDWFGSTFFGTTPTSKGGNVQAAPMCLRGGKCDRMSFPTQNYFSCDDKNSPGGWRAECPSPSCVKNDNSGCTYLPGPAKKMPLACFPKSAGKAPGGKTYFYDYATSSCIEDLTSSRGKFGKQWQSATGPTGPPDGCNFVCSNNSSTIENFQTDAPSPGCGIGGSNCAVGQTCYVPTNTCVSTNKTCFPVGDDAQPAPGTTLSDLQASPGYCCLSSDPDCIQSDNQTKYCNTGTEGPLVQCNSGEWGGNNVYTNCKIGGVNFATGGNSDTIFNGYCASQEIKSYGNYDGGWLGPFGIGVRQVDATDTVKPLCFNNPAYAQAFDSTDNTTSVDPSAAFIGKTRDGNNYLTCVLPQEYVNGGNQLCTADSDCTGQDGQQQICVGSYGGIVPNKTSLGETNNMNPGYCVNVSPCPNKPTLGQQCLTDTTGKKYLAECSGPAGKLLDCIRPPTPSGIVAAMCAMPTETDARKAVKESKLGTRGICLSIDSGTNPNAKRHHAGSTSTKPDPCYRDTADACSNSCNSAGLKGIQVPPGYVLSCRNVGLLGAAADWFGQAIGPIGGGVGDPFGGITKILMWIGIILGVGIVILGILSLFIKRLESALFSWM